MISLQFWQLLTLIGTTGVLLLAGVLIGAYAVFRTKREAHESFIGPVGNKGEVFSIDALEEDEETEQPAEMPEGIRGRNEDFTAQFVERLGHEGS